MTTAGRAMLAIAATALAAAGAQGPASKPAPAGEPDAATQYDRLVRAYLDGQWKQLTDARRSLGGRLDRLAEAQRDDVAYLDKAVADHRPAWWQACKSGKKARLDVPFWDKSFSIAYAPREGIGWSYRQEGAWMVCSAFWDPNAMDSDQPVGGSLGRRGFSQGVQFELNLWNALMSAHVLSRMTVRELVGFYGTKGPDGVIQGGDEKKRLRFQQLQSFTGELAGLYYVGPPARQASMVWCMAPYKLDDTDLLRPRRAIAAMLVATFLADFSKWPSLALPDERDGDTEKSTAMFYHFRLLKPWTLAEDRALREAAWKFQQANPGRQVFNEGRIDLPNGLKFLFDMAQDAARQSQRDAWVKQHLQKARAAGR